MSRITPWILAGALGIGLGAGAVWFLRPVQPLADTAVRPATAPVPRPAETVTAPAVPQQQPAEAPPPWMAGAGTGPASASASGTSASAPALAEVQQKLMTLINSGKPPEIAEVDALLGELQQAHGDTVVGGVDISVLRGNLALAGEMQALAMEIEQLSRQPGGADSAALQRKLDRLQALQAQMRFDFMAPAQQ